MAGLIGKKLGMSQIFDEKGRVIPVTLVLAGPCQVVQVKTETKDGYTAIQLGFEEQKKTSRVKKPLQGHFKKHNTKNYRYLREFQFSPDMTIATGDIFDVELFKVHEIIKVTGTSKGKGFAGVMKRYKFSGFEQTHGVHESFRGPGSVGQCAQPSRIFKGQKMPGHMGSERVSVKNLKIVKIDKENNIIMISGAIPGAKNSIVYISRG
jgi:large subunit ribosomal protein L3